MNKSFATPTFSLLTAMLALAGCVVQAPPPPRVVYAAPAPAVSYVPQPPPPVVSVYIEPPLVQPPPVVIGWAPPPMLVEAPPVMPFEGAVWIGGYWAWHGNWVWSAGRWAPPPQPGYGWVHPYYENRGGVVVFVSGHWAAPGVVFVPPPPSLNLTVAVALAGVVPGPRPIGPPGVFVPPPPGSRPGLIVPAPIGTPPAVVIGAPPVTNVGMRIQSRVENTTVNNTRVTNITNVTNVTVVAPASATLSGHAFEAQVPNQAHLAAAQTPVVHAIAPTPASNRPMAAFAADRAPVPLPVPQPVQTRPAMAAPAGAPATSPAPVQRTEALPVQSARPEHPMPAPASRATDPTPVAPASAAAPTPHTPQVQADNAARQAAKRQQAEARRAEAAKAKAAKEKPPRKEEEHEHEHEHKQE